MARVEQIKKFTILESDWQPGGDELTPTMKLKRKPIDEKYAEEIEALYSRRPRTSFLGPLELVLAWTALERVPLAPPSKRSLPLPPQIVSLPAALDHVVAAEPAITSAWGCHPRLR